MSDKKRERMRLPVSVIAMVFLAFAFLCFQGNLKKTQGFGDYSPGVANVAGFAWSSTFGWISMNCNNPGKFNTCASAKYGVNINTTAESAPYDFSGHAWSSNAGWISFQYDSIPPPDNWKFKSNCFAGYACDNTTNCTACYNPNNGKIYGWARVVNLGKDGWIYLSATSSPVAIPGVYIDQTNASGTFVGFGWNGNTDKTKGLGWISFNCNNPGYFNTCGTASYFTYLLSHNLPAAINLSAPNWSTSSACTTRISKSAFLNWSSNVSPGNSIAYYRIIFNNLNSTTTGSYFDTGKRAMVLPQFFVSSTNSLMTYGAHIYWWVKLWDNFGFSSPWHQFNTAVGDTLTDNLAGNAAGGNSKTFTNYLHEMPIARFSYKPLIPLYGNPVTTTDASLSYTSGPVPVSCWTPPRCTWNWSSNSNMLTNSTPNASTTVMTFKYSKASNPAKIFLTIKDSDNYSCSTSSPGFIVDLLPNWKEKQAQ